MTTRRLEKQNNGLGLFNHPLHKNFLSLFGDDWFVPAETARESNFALSEDDQHVFVSVSLPGIKQDELEVTVDKGVLWVKAEKSSEKEEEGKRKHYYKMQGSYSYRLQLPDKVDFQEEPEATLSDGVLEMTFSKTRKDSPRRITVNSK